MAKKPPKPRAVVPKSIASRKTKKRETPTIAPVITNPTSKFTIGDRVSHQMFGDGTVTAVDGNTLTVDFADNVVKQIIDGYVNRRKQ
jgi:DNA helicase II / ATP-dependent DNA helicase PcrA